jgi:Tol biopolymer transport system component
MLTLWLLTACLAQRPAAGPVQSAEDAAQEARHLRNVRQVTYGFPRAGEGYFSPDGTKIVFQAYPPVPPTILRTPPPNAESYQIYLADLATNAAPRLVSTGRGACTCAFFHPDGKSLIFGSSHLDPEADAPRPPRGPAYSRSERYKWEFPEYMEIFRTDLDGGGMTRLTDAPGYDAEGSYSADGKSIVFTSFRDGNAEIYVMDADGSNPRRITNAAGYDGGPFFSPDGKRIVYRSDRKENDLLQLFVNNVEGTAERQLTDNEFVNWGPYWHPDSRHIVYATSKHGHANYEIYLMDVDSGREERVTFHEGFDGLPVFSPDGTKLMWTSSGRTEDKKSQLFIADFVGGPEAPAATAAAAPNP